MTLRRRLISACRLPRRAPAAPSAAWSRGFASSQRESDEPEAAARSLSFAQEFVKPRMDATFLVDNYTAPALAAAYQDRCALHSLGDRMQEKRH